MPANLVSTRVLRHMDLPQVPTASVVVKLAKRYDLELPIFQAIDALLEGKITLKDGMPLIMDRPLHDED